MFLINLRSKINEQMLSEFDDFYGKILLKTMKLLPNLKNINLENLNFDDKFCIKLSKILQQKI